MIEQAELVAMEETYKDHTSQDVLADINRILSDNFKEFLVNLPSVTPGEEA